MLLRTDAKKRVLILMSDTGGGHRAAAEAIRDALYRKPGADAVAVELVDVFRDYSPAPFKYLPEIYPWWVNNSKQSWGAGYKLSNTRQRARILSTTIFHTLELGLKRLLREHPADVIVCVHSALARPAMKAMQSQPGRAPFVVVVTDLVSTHHMWYEQRAERTLVPTAAALDRGRENGLSDEQLRLTGLPVHPDFIDGLTDQASARKALGLDPQLPAVLLVGGVDGMGPVYQTALAINERRPPCQLLIITGRNEALRQRLGAVAWHQPTQVYGFRATCRWCWRPPTSSSPRPAPPPSANPASPACRSSSTMPSPARKPATLTGSSSMTSASSRPSRARSATPWSPG